MSELVTPSGTVHWVGAGLSSGGGLVPVHERADRLLLWNRRPERAEALLERLGLPGAAVRGYDRDALAAEISPGDVVVSMVPADLHTELLDACLERRAHFVCSSYVSEAMAARGPAAERSGLVVQTEAGLDPGIDHLLAHVLVGDAREALGDGPASVAFTSYCGGVPAEPNDFRYRFSWAPRGVLTALLTPARHIEEGEERTAERPWEATVPYELDGETFEALPNRDSVPFVAQYGFPSAWRIDTFIRGTLRLDGWLDAWSQVFAVLREGDGTRIDALAKDLAARYPATDADLDRVVLAVSLDARGPTGRWHGRCVLDVVGDRHESAMARCVSLPLACAITRLLDGATPPGLRRAAESARESREWLDLLGRYGLHHRTEVSAP
ncbi:saccharopine dehydrogenase family protein [Actinomadura yumaensis]|uniref:Saccharopine dehydrogenase family protein n=2 Tax=Actinomadura yumaensis TaxID=111807 RepID=A0ABW2CF98_9ACTN